MKDEIAIAFTGVTKSFPGRNPRVLLRSHVSRWTKKTPEERFVALKDVTFEVRKGESLGLIGFNGAGKSTLMSLIVGLTLPDRGRIRVNGRVSALLEIGSGFHPDLTGAENLRLNAALLGLTRRQIEEKLESILEFAEIGEFIHEPLRTYSAGMMMRLAFSVAINADADVLVIDEVLGVGDQAFQAKCFKKIWEFRERGRTIICASHSADMVERLCQRAIWLHRGEIIMDDSVRRTLQAYESGLSGRREA
jgi:ABC-type polysaccharide/polyol phosphate transport system ATPase subunit